MSIFVKKGDITQINCDAIVNAANSFGYMGGGVAGAIKRVGGNEIEKEAVAKAPINVGEAIVTTSGSLPCKYVIHAPTMRRPAMKIPLENVKVATKAALDLAVKINVKTIVIPAMGTGVGGVKLSDAAEIMVNIAKEYVEKFEEIIFIGINEDFVDTFTKYL